jgi:ribosomal protein L11 methyltransferase
MWAIRVVADADRLAAVEAALEPLAVALSSFEANRGRAWTVEALTGPKPDPATVQAALEAVGAPPASFVYLPPRDWVTESQRHQPPVRAGRFFVHGSHVRGPPPRGTLAIEIDAGMAFGTGRHESTRGCLLALDRLARSGVRCARPLDLGCGSGILALAMARLWRVPVLAADNDPVAVAVARQNAQLNGLADSVRVVKSDGLATAAIRRRSPFDLICANILAKPLERLAPTIAHRLTARGRAVLSGLMADQEAEVLAAYRGAGLALERRLRLGDWSVLMLAKGAGRDRRRNPTGSRRRA